MAYSNAIQTYKKTNVETADIVKLVIMCYEAAINDLEAAKELHGSHSQEASYNKIRHAQDLITELLVGLDYERGGEIAQNLSKLYNFMLRQMIGINIRQDTAMYDHLIHMLRELKDAWQQIRQEGIGHGVPSASASGRSWRIST